MVDILLDLIKQNTEKTVIAGLLIVLLILLVIMIANARKKHRRNHKDDDEFYMEMDGAEFEEYCARLLQLNGFTEIEMTPASSDFGVDIFAEKEGITYAFQCKRYDHPVGTKAVQEIYAGRDFYHSMVGVVITNQKFTSGACKMAEALNILLWGGDVLALMEENSEIN